MCYEMAMQKMFSHFHIFLPLNKTMCVLENIVHIRFQFQYTLDSTCF